MVVGEHFCVHHCYRFIS